MRLIYCKSTEKRARQFQIYTCIMQRDDGMRYVVKKAVYSEGKEHIKDILKNYILLDSILPNQVVGCDEIENGIMFPYIYGQSYEVLIRKHLLENNSINHWRDVLGEWIELIVGNKKNEMKFDNSTEFQKVFGSSEKLKGDAALKITNFDGIAENILSTKEGMFFIDYEWVFDFPIPRDLTIYRVIKQFYLNNKLYFDWNRLLEAVSINDEEKIVEYERLLDNFNLYVSLDKQNNILYENLGKIYKEPKLTFLNANGKKKYLFPKDAIKKGKRIILYGAGEVGMSYYQDLINDNEYSLIGWVDKNYTQYKSLGYDVSAVDLIMEKEYDNILLAIYNQNVATEIIEELGLIGVDSTKIIWIKPQIA